MFTVAAAPFRMPNALTMGGGMRSCGWLMRKFSRERSVCAPQYRSAATCTAPKASVSVLVAFADVAAILAALAWNRRYCWIAGCAERAEALSDATGDDTGRPPSDGAGRDDACRHVLNGLMVALGTLTLPRAAGPATRTDRSMAADVGGEKTGTVAECGR